MKKSTLFFTLLFFNCFHFAFSQGSNYSIKVKINGPKDKYVHLAHFFGYNQYIKVDSAKLTDGYYHFKGSEPLKGGIYLIVLKANQYYDFVVSGTEKDIEIEADTVDFVKSVKFKGSKENDILFGYRKYLAEKSAEAGQLSRTMQTATDPTAMEAARNKMNGLQKEVTDYMQATVKNNPGTFAAKVIKANMEPEMPKEVPKKADGKTDSTALFNNYKAHYFDNLDFTDERMLRTPFLQSKIEKYFKELVYQVKDSVIHDADRVIMRSKKNQEVYRYVLWMITNKYENTEIVGLDGVFVHLAENYYMKDATWLDSTQRAKFVERVTILKPLQTGVVFPSLVLSDTLGKEFNVLNSTAKYTVVYFYSPDCGHCKDNAPKLVKTYDELKLKGVEIYNISIDYEPEKMLKFINTYKTGKMKNLWDAKQKYYFRNNFDVYSTPTSYILDSKKRIIAKRIPIEEIDGFLQFYEKQQAAQSKM